MILTEVAPVPLVALPVAQFRDHLRLGTGFPDEAAEDGLLETYLRAAIAAVEARTGKVLIARTFSWTLTRWRDERVQALPVAPVTAITGLWQRDVSGAETVVDPTLYTLVQDTHRPLIQATGSCQPVPPTNGSLRIQFTAGFGPLWPAVPADLSQAVMLLAAYYFEYRHELRSGAAEMPYGVSSLLERWRSFRLLGGRGARR